MKKHFFLFMMTLLPVLASADAIEIGGIYYNLIDKTGAAEVTSNPNGYSGSINIPDKFVYEGTEYSVEIIGDKAFRDCSGLNSITIPNTVTSIGDIAFSGCTGLASINIPNSVTSIGEYAFGDCTSLTSIDIPNSVTSIGKGAFGGCTALTSITIPNSVTIIEDLTFKNCTSLTSINIPNSVTRIGSESRISNAYIWDPSTFGVFYNCTNLTSITIPNSVTSIEACAFGGCTALTSITIPNSVTHIGLRAFQGCISLAYVSIGKSVTLIENFAFAECTALNTIEFHNETIDRTFRANKYLKEVIIGDGVTDITIGAFEGCENLTRVTMGNTVTSIGEKAFYSCGLLTDVTIGNSVTSIGNSAFYSCGIKSIDIPNSVTSIGDKAFCGCTGLASIDIPNSVATIGAWAFAHCSNLTSVTIGHSTTQIGNGAFAYCNLINGVTIFSDVLESIGTDAFKYEGTVSVDGPLKLMCNTPPTLGNTNALGKMIIQVPDESVSLYRTEWSDMASRIIPISAPLEYDIYIKASQTMSALHGKIGEENLQTVLKLKISGSINGYDIMVIRNKMSRLHYLDLTDANIVASSYEYYPGCHTENDEIGPYSFFRLGNLYSIQLPESVKKIGDNAFAECYYLKEVNFPEGIQSIGTNAFYMCRGLFTVNLPSGLETVGSCAFKNCAFLSTVTMEKGLKLIDDAAFAHTAVEQLNLPEGLETIGAEAFSNNEKLMHVAFPSTLESIGNHAFYCCSKLENISLPTSLKSIADRAFGFCNLKEVHIPSSVKTIGDYAFMCSNLHDVYTYIVEPPAITSSTFANYQSATLWVPKTSYYNYWYDIQWGQFSDIKTFDAEYEYFYVNNDFTISDEQGTLKGESIEADVNPGSGLIVATTQDKQQLDLLHIKADQTKTGSVISTDNIEANKVRFDINVQQDRWYFISSPFRVKRDNIEAPGLYVFRYYDGTSRAKGQTGWTDWTSDELMPGKGYIFQTNTTGTLSLGVEKDDMDWKADDRPQALEAYVAQKIDDASWNFVGNPHTSYFDIDETGYQQPITVWNGSTYDAVRPGDDDYSLRPFEAFFVQKPKGQAEIDFPAEGRATYQQTLANSEAKQARRRAQGVSTDRQIVNLTLTDGLLADKTRVVFNEKKSVGYEMDCDAAKFMSTERVPQLYTLDQQQARYAINERPSGEVPVGYAATAKGELSISVTRMDQPMLLRDQELGVTHDLSLGAYTFTTEAGNFDRRFTLLANHNATGVGELLQQTGVSLIAEQGGIAIAGSDSHDVAIYSTDGVLLVRQAADGFISLPKGAYVIKVDNRTAKLLVR